MEKVDGIDGYNHFIQAHGAQLRMSAVPEWFWHSLYQKLKNETFDAGESFMMAQLEDGGLTVVMNREEGMDCEDSAHIYLIDHAWTFEVREAPLQLRCVPGLLARISALVGLKTELDTDQAVEEVCRVMWKYLRTYSRVISPEDPPVTFWYVMDEFGSTIQHSSSPNFRAVPFFYHADSTAYTLLFPVKNVEENEQVLIDYVEGVGNKDPKAREALLVPWKGQSFTDEPPNQLEPDEDYFLSGAQLESLPDVITEMPPLPSVLKVYTEYPLVRDYLKSPGFVVTQNENEADILWLTKHYSDYKGLAESRPGTFINQFPSERVITTKDLIAIIARRAGGSPKWLPITYNLMTELPAFVGTFQRRESQGLDNHWICKPWNLARALDTTVTNNLNCILRLPFSGPKVAQKYAENPVLFYRPGVGHVKFDVRYVVLLESVKPLKLYCYKQFFLRFANKQFDLSDLWDYEKHFTVMNYRDESQLHRMLCEEFMSEFGSQYPEHPWAAVEESLLAVLKEVFVAGCAAPPPRGLAHNPQSRALYAADIMLAWNGNDIQPLILEINYGPDCDRACQYYPEFYDDIFNLLFKSKLDTSKFHVL